MTTGKKLILSKLPAMKSIRFSLIILLSIFVSNASLAKDPSSLIIEIVDEAATVLSSSKSVNLKIETLNDIAERSVDIDGIGMYTLGKYRKSLNDEQKEKYKKLFKLYFLKSFSSRLVDYTDPKIQVVSQKKINEKYTIVNSLLEATSKRPQVKIDWRVYTKNPDKPLIRDLIVEGLSLARTQKEEFNSVIQNNGGDIGALFKTLEAFIIK